jgi:DNA end-binding protein Ku
MARSIWSGVLSFGLVSATEAHEPAFHQFEKGTSDRIRYRRVKRAYGGRSTWPRFAPMATA